MTKEQRTAMARIISDMIKADNIIEESEIKDMKDLMTRYDIKREHMSDARNICFSEAVTVLQEMKKSDRQDFFNCIYKIALSDNVCVPKEALLLIALQYCLVDHDRKDHSGKKLSKPYLISCPTGETSISDQYMVYLESSYEEERNKEIMGNFKLLVAQCRLNGFNFVYIPKMVEEFKGMDKQYVTDVIGYMAPQLSEDVVSDVYGRLCQMTTKEFFHSVLYERLQVRALYNAQPSILINIGTSVVPYCATDGSVQYYTEFLCIPIADTTLSLVEELLNFYHSKVSVKTVTVTDNEGQFKYFGFYKAMFDFLIAPPPVAPDLVFLGQDITDGKYYVSFKIGGTDHLLQLMPKRYDLYYKIATETYRSNSKGVPTIHVDRTVLSHLKGDISEINKDVSFADQYKPEKDGNKYSLRVDAEKVLVRKYSNAKRTVYVDIPIKEYVE